MPSGSLKLDVEPQVVLEQATECFEDTPLQVGVEPLLEKILKCRKAHHLADLPLRYAGTGRRPNESREKHS